MEVELTVRSPVHIGTGEERSTQEYVFERGRAYRPHLDGYFDDNPEEVDAFVSAMEDGQSMSDFFNNIGRYINYAMETVVSKQEVGQSPIQVFLKSRGKEPYIPGSSLKGAIRTALACQVIREGAEVAEFTREGIESLFSLGEFDPQRDVLQCLTVRDASVEARSKLPIALYKIKTHSLTQHGNMEPKFWSTYAECLRPETKLTTGLNVDIGRLERMVDEFGHRDVVDRLFGSERTAAAIQQRIRAALQTLAREVIEQDRELTGEFDDVESFYGRLADRPGVPLRVGFGTGWHSNTVGTALSQAELLAARSDGQLGKPTRHEDCGGILVEDDHSPGMLFCTDCYTGGIDPTGDQVSMTPFPKTRRLVHRNGTPACSLGWLTLAES